MAYERLVLENRLSIERLDIFKNKVIAMDRKNKKLVLIYHTDRTQQELCIPLLQVAACSIIEERDQQDQCIKKIFLNLKLRNLIHHLFCFYDDSKDDVMEMPTLSRQAVNWSKSINIHRYPGNIGIEQEYIV
ncbi:hypothetical protein OCK74_22245 [Chitinophagaceae bacterium LB-8]|uniref:Uncharacterized protein n=1 Tax=Paraflavisolibacter caeni TaxID=2982496 RepID=A0A9X3BIS2_9BACT|nr:hypothetical protein [Paraflavisolibacter caeni]MCU7551857.1 hypothetical protein [Paraflavisolibacter caeni]